MPVTLSCQVKNFLHIPYDKGHFPVCVSFRITSSHLTEWIISYIYITRKTTIPSTGTLSEYIDPFTSDLAMFKTSYSHHTKKFAPQYEHTDLYLNSQYKRLLMHVTLKCTGRTTSPYMILSVTPLCKRFLTHMTQNVTFHYESINVPPRHLYM
jgi:hypothetical protein